jgi:uncharacterized protein (UPF0333 family)
LVAVGASTMAMAPVLTQTASGATAETAAGDTKSNRKSIIKSCGKAQKCRALKDRRKRRAYLSKSKKT